MTYETTDTFGVKPRQRHGGIKKGSRNYLRTALKNGTKKGKRTPTALEVPLPVIFSTFNRGGYLLQG